MNSTSRNFSSSDNRFSISDSKVTGYFSMPVKHFHDKFEIYYLISGKRYYFIKDKTFLINKGHLVFIGEGEPHKTSDTGMPDHERILVYFTRDFLKMQNPSMDAILELLKGKRYYVLSLTMKEQQFVETIFNDMYVEAEKQLLGYEICLQGLLMRLLAFIARYTGNNEESSFVSHKPRHDKVSEIVQYINENYMESLSVPLISERFFTSQYYLSRIFKETTGFTLVEYINNVRVNEAKKLLSQSGLKAINIAEETGFGSLAHFNRVFKAVAGCSPLNYRKLCQI
jgi:AraC-like DNA-binding protein